MRREMDRMFDNFLTRWGNPPWAGEGNGGPEAGALANMGLASLEVTDSEKEIAVSLELPGMSEKDVEVKVSGDLLTIEGEKTEEKEKKEGERAYSERRYGRFSRSVRLPFAVGDEKVEASFDKGVLTVRVEKPASEQAKTRQIEVKAA
jgi:HSP20 family protein